MALEIERKFLVTGAAWRTAAPTYICQGYLSRDKGRTVRVRIAGSAAWLAVKGPSEGATRSEFEYAVPLEDARQMLALCEGPPVEKRRHLVEYRGHTWEVDEFLGDNAGLVVAEIELPTEDTVFERPEWVAREVTQDPRYFNSALAAHPYKRWQDR